MNQTNKIIHGDWHGCYNDSWKGIIVPEAFAHPAKMACGLTNRIFKHALSEGWIRPGDVVVDPFGGIGSTGIVGGCFGLKVVCVELEQKFVSLAEQNFKLNRKAFECGHFGQRYQPQIIQGDSRRLSEVIASCDIVLGSPPFSVRQPTANARPGEETPLQKMPADDYGQTPGQLGAMKPGSVEAIISSPPYESAIEKRKGPSGLMGGTFRLGRSDMQANAEGYGATDGNIGNDRGETFWQAARQIVSECHKILKPGGHAIWVVKAFVRKGKIVDFPGDWRRLCESQGFETACEHHAMLVKETRHDGLFGEITETKERKSFFRRLAEKKGSPKIDYEVVICTQKPKTKELF